MIPVNILVKQTHIRTILHRGQRKVSFFSWYSGATDVAVISPVNDYGGAGLEVAAYLVVFVDTIEGGNY